MGEQKNIRGVTAIIPAYNEAERLSDVLDVIVSYPGFSEIIVVDDGSVDGTSSVAHSYGVTVLRHEKNLGKGRAIGHGTSVAKNDIIFCSDADIIGLSHRMIDSIVSPVRDGEVDMFIGLQERGIYKLRPVLLFTPLLGGERAFTRELWNKIPSEYKERFRVETALNFYALHAGKSFRYDYFPGLGQTVKEQKYGLLKGLIGRFRMIGEIVSINYRLHSESFSFRNLWRRSLRSFSVRLSGIS